MKTYLSKAFVCLPNICLPQVRNLSMQTSCNKYLDSSATYIAAAKVGTCSYRKKAYGIIKMRKFECQKMGGRWNGRPGQRSWTDCHLDWCQIPRGRKRKEIQQPSLTICNCCDHC